MNSCDITFIDVLPSCDLINYVMRYLKSNNNVDSFNYHYKTFIKDFNIDYVETIQYIINHYNISQDDTVYNFLIKMNRKPKEYQKFTLINGQINYKLFNIECNGIRNTVGYKYKLNGYNFLTIDESSEYVWLIFDNKKNLDDFLTYINIDDLCKNEDISIANYYYNTFNTVFIKDYNKNSRYNCVLIKVY